MWFKCITNVTSENQKHLPHEPSEMISRRAQGMEIKTLEKHIDRYQFCLQESLRSSRAFLDFRTFVQWTAKTTPLKNHACHASTVQKEIFINAHVALMWVYLGRPLTFFIDHFWIPGRSGVLRRHFHLISSIWFATEGFLDEQIYA